MSNHFTPNREDVDLMHYMRDHSSSLDRDNLLLQWMGRLSDSRKKAEDALEEYGRACGVVYAMQLIRAYGPLAMGKAKR
jgi:hypothetical protein